MSPNIKNINLFSIGTGSANFQTFRSVVKAKRRWQENETRRKRNPITIRNETEEKNLNLFSIGTGSANFQSFLRIRKAKARRQEN